jgi:hypothetical protein
VPLSGWATEGEAEGRSRSPALPTSQPLEEVLPEVGVAGGWSGLVMAWRGSPRACFLNSGSEMQVATSAGRVAIAVHCG